jgi:hypothetical protein
LVGCVLRLRAARRRAAAVEAIAKSSSHLIARIPHP